MERKYRMFKLALKRLREAGVALDLSGYLCQLVSDANPEGDSQKGYIINGWTKRRYDGLLFVRCENAPRADAKRGFVWEESSETELSEYVASLDAIETH